MCDQGFSNELCQKMMKSTNIDPVLIADCEGEEKVLLMCSHMIWDLAELLWRVTKKGRGDNIPKVNFELNSHEWEW